MWLSRCQCVMKKWAQNARILKATVSQYSFDSQLMSIQNDTNTYIYQINKDL